MRLVPYLLLSTLVACATADPSLKDAETGEDLDDSGENGGDSGGESAEETDSGEDSGEDSGGDTGGETGGDTGGETGGENGGGDEYAFLIDGAWGFEFGDANITKPAGLGSLLGQYITQPIMVGVVDVTANTIDILGGLGLEGGAPYEQDTCSQTFSFPTGDFGRAPYFQVGPGSTSLDVSGYAVPVENLVITGTFAADGSKIDDMTFEGLVDTSGLGALLGDSDPGAVCDLAASFGASCVDCPTSGDPYCLEFAADSITAIESVGPLVEVTSPC